MRLIRKKTPVRHRREIQFALAKSLDNMVCIHSCAYIISDKNIKSPLPLFFLPQKKPIMIIFIFNDVSLFRHYHHRQCLSCLLSTMRTNEIWSWSVNECINKNIIEVDKSNFDQASKENGREREREKERKKEKRIEMSCISECSQFEQKWLLALHAQEIDFLSLDESTSLQWASIDRSRWAKLDMTFSDRYR